MILGFIIETAVGLFCVVLGLLIWKKQKISIIHEYHYRNVSGDDIPDYAKVMGIGIILVGAGICVTGFFVLFDLPYWWIPLTSGTVSGLALINKAQRKYNGSWFS